MALRDFNRPMMLPMRVWDVPTRLFHWSCAVLVALSYLSVELGWMRIHLLSGTAVLALLLFRFGWGCVGSETARFSRFLASPAKVVRQLVAFFRQPGPDTEVGNSAAGGWMVLVLLVLLAVQVASGLFSGQRHGNLPGPLMHDVSASAANAAAAIHSANFNLLIAAVGLHVLAVLAYAVVRKHDLVRPMITGVKRLPAATHQPRMASPLRALLLAAASGLAAWLVGSRL
jgi:cytochrome b